MAKLGLTAAGFFVLAMSVSKAMMKEAGIGVGDRVELEQKLERLAGADHAPPPAAGRRAASQSIRCARATMIPSGTRTYAMRHMLSY